MFRPDLTTIVVMGEITPGKAREVIEKYFGEWRASGPKPPNDLAARAFEQAFLHGSARFQPRAGHRDLGEVPSGLPDRTRITTRWSLEITFSAAGFYATRLYRDLRENGGLVYNVSSSFEIGKSRGLYVVHFACDPQNVFEARAIVERDLAQMQMTPVTPQENLRQAKAILLREIPLSESSVDRIAAGLISRTIDDLPLDEPTLAAHRYLRLSAADVKEAFAKWLRVNDLVQVTEGPTPKI